MKTYFWVAMNWGDRDENLISYFQLNSFSIAQVYFVVFVALATRSNNRRPVT